MTTILGLRTGMGGPEKRRVTTPWVQVFSKASPGGQWSARVLAPLACALGAGFCASTGQAAPFRPHTPSGEPVPRYVTLKAAPVNARAGPGEDYRALWQYTARGVPLQVVEETADWRRVCDPEGGLGWVKAIAVDRRRTAMRLGARDLLLRAHPAPDARPVAALAARAVADLMTCRGGWCRLSVDHATGWVRANEIWGANETPQCRARRR